MDAEKGLESAPAAAAVADRSLIVDWDGPNDPQNPQNWSQKEKMAAIAIVSLITFITPLASSIFAPSIDMVMVEFKSTSPELASFMVSVYLIGYCFGPLAIAPLSEMYGRSILYNVCNVLFVIFSVACALAPSLPSLIVFRLLAGLVGSCPLTVGPGSIADMMHPERRGLAMSLWMLGPLMGPVVGPLAGGYLSEARGWRWSFWVVSISAGAVSIASFIFLRESYAYTILERKTKRLRKETGNNNLRSALDTGRSAKSLFKLALVRPTKMLLFSPIVSILSLYMAIVYGYLYLLFTAFPVVFEQKYQFSTGSIGLSYLGIGAGQAIGLVANTFISDRLAVSMKLRNGGDIKPEYRIPPLIFASFITPVGLFWFGWAAEKDQHWIQPIIGSGLFGLGIIVCFIAISVYIVDAFGTYAASATAASTVLRALVGALLPLGGRQLFEVLGLGWGSSLLAFIALAMAPMPFAFYKYGERIRRKRLFNVEF